MNATHVVTVGLLLSINSVFADDVKLDFLAGVEAGIDTKTAMSNTDLNQTQEALSTQPIGVARSWYNKESSTLYNIKIVEYFQQNDHVCVNYDLIINHEENLSLKALNACLNYQGNWIAQIEEKNAM